MNLRQETFIKLAIMDKTPAYISEPVLRSNNITVHAIINFAHITLRIQPIVSFDIITRPRSIQYLPCYFISIIVPNCVQI